LIIAGIRFRSLPTRLKHTAARSGGIGIRMLNLSFPSARG
jgi:hypothetical protein